MHLFANWLSSTKIIPLVIKCYVAHFHIFEQPTAMSSPKLFYWRIKARAHLATIIAAYTGEALEWESNPDWPAM
jgi:hypothetical protein